jgi:hypothetical protein
LTPQWVEPQSANDKRIRRTEMKVLGIAAVVFALIGPFWMGTRIANTRGYPVDAEISNIGDIQHALALISAGAMVSAALAASRAGKWQNAILMVCVSICVVSTASLILCFMMTGRNFQPFLTFAILFAGGLITICVPEAATPSDSRPNPDGATTPP